MSMKGCPGSRAIDFGKTEQKQSDDPGKILSELKQWPVQMHLIAPTASYFTGADVLLAADCVAFSYGDFHRDFLKGKSLGVACPKLDSNQEVYIEKIRSWIDDAKINTLTVAIMQVPCCRGLLQIVNQALQKAVRKVPVKCVVLGLQGEILQEEWI